METIKINAILMLIVIGIFGVMGKNVLKIPSIISTIEAQATEINELKQQKNYTSVQTINVRLDAHKAILADIKGEVIRIRQKLE